MIFAGFRIGAIIALLAAWIFVPAATDAAPRGERSPAAETPFGIHFSWIRDAEDLAEIPGTSRKIRELGVQVVRLNLLWSQVEPSRGRYDWSIPDRVLREFEGTDTKFLFRLYASSSWGTKSSSGFMLEKRNPRPNRPVDMKVYEEFVRQMVRRYKERVPYWQIENEIYDHGHFWAGSDQDYLDLLKAASRVIREEAPRAMVLPAGIAIGTEDPEDVMARMDDPKIGKAVSFVDRVLDEGRDAFDLLDVHLYWKYDAIPDRIRFFRDRMRKFGYEKPMAVTETGGPDIRAYLTKKEFREVRRGNREAVLRENPAARAILSDRYSDDRGRLVAEEVVKRYTLAFVSGVDMVFWLRLYATGEDGYWDKMGLADKRDPGRQTGAEAYRLLVRELSGFTAATPVSLGEGVTAVRFTRKEGDVYVVWSDRGAEAKLGVGWDKARIVPAVGAPSVQKVQGGGVALKLNSVPVFVEQSL